MNYTNISGMTNATSILQTQVAGITFENMLLRLKELVLAPYYNKEMIWIVAPLFLSLFLMQLYFGRYKREELGWNTAVGNSLALIFVAVDLLRHIYLNSSGMPLTQIVITDTIRVTFVLALGLVSFWLLFGEFFHAIPKKLAFFISSSLPTSFLAYISIVVVYVGIKLDLATLFASLLFFILLAIVFWIIHLLEPISKED